jgi:hypothetical protein
MRIARVVALDNKVQYVSNALEHHGWLMQRRYVGIGPARYERAPAQPGRLSAPLGKVFDRFVLQYYPVLNAAELARDILPYALVADWAAVHHAGTFHHPVYAKYCLRWGNNSGLRQVAAMEAYERIAEATPVYFSAQTEWPAGETLYTLESPLATDDPLLLDLQARAGLQALSPYPVSSDLPHMERRMLPVSGKCWQCMPGSGAGSSGRVCTK